MILKLSKLLFLMTVVVILGERFLRADNTAFTTYGFSTETFTGLNYDLPLSTDADRGQILQWNNGGGCFKDDLYYTEGTTALGMSTVGIGGWAGFMICFGTHPFDWSSAAYIMDKDMSRYTGGSIEFDIMLNMTSPFYTPPSAIQFQLQWAVASGTEAKSDVMTLDQYGIASNGNWQHCSMPFTGFKDTTYNGTTYYFVNQPGGNDGIKHFNGMIFNVGLSSACFFLDNLVWKSTSTGSMNIGLYNRSNDVAASSFTWSGVNLGTTKWKAADQYIKLQTDYYYRVAPVSYPWGIQIYTDNQNAGANPRYTGTVNPVGLICTSTTTVVLPTCWRIVDTSTTTLTIVMGDKKLYSQELGGPASNFPCFLWMRDKNSPGFVNSEDYVTVWDNRGIQYSETAWGGALPPNYIYIGADFSNATTPNTYSTNRLTLELFHD
jgi:hypothetical protein